MSGLATPGPSTSARPALPTWFDDESPQQRWVGWWRTAAGLAAVALAGGLWLADRQAAAICLFGIIALTLGFVLGIMLLRRVLSGSHPVIGVAGAIVEEAISTRLSIVLVMLVVVTLPALPLLLDPAERLEYRVQFFLNWSLSSASILLAMITIALGCSSVCGDIDSRRIHMALSKPLRRWEYLVGKWLGVVLLDLLLVGLVGIGVATFALAQARARAVDAADRIAVDEQVLTARASARPLHPSGTEFETSIEATIEQIRKDDPTLFDKDPARARKRIYSQRIHEWHTITADVVSSFVFTGLDPKHIRSPVVQLRLEPYADNSSISRADVRFALWLDERPFPVRDGVHEDYTFSTGTVHTIDLPVSAITPDGTLRLTMANRNLVMPGEDRPTSISFTPGKGLEVLYRVGGFGGNFLRCLVVMWAKLAMLAAVALAAAAWLGFPTALLTSLVVFVTAVASAFFADAIDIYTGLDRRDATLVSMLRLRLGIFAERLQKVEWWEAIKTVGSYFADMFLSLVPSFADYDSVTQVAGGRVVPLAEVGFAILLLGVLYPLLLLGIGWFFLERRDLVSTAS
jgi:ABC-type transport system involved in multi-copper enzyme maturation permease subunit